MACPTSQHAAKEHVDPGRVEALWQLLFRAYPRTPRRPAL
jgi:hypothetical protein